MNWFSCFATARRPIATTFNSARFGRNRTNVWNYPGANVFKRSRRKSDLDLHPTVKPIAMVADAILDSTNLDDIILDPFLVSGTTLLRRTRAQAMPWRRTRLAPGRWRVENAAARVVQAKTQFAIMFDERFVQA